MPFKVIFFLDDYLPDCTQIHARMMHDLAIAFTKLGIKVVVLTPGGPKLHKKLEIKILDNVEIWRFKSLPTRGQSHIKRLIGETFLPLTAYWAMRSTKLDLDFDACINYSPTIFFGPLAKWFKIKGAFVYLILRDFFPKWIIDDGLISNKSFAATYLRFFEALNYKASDVIAVQSSNNKKVFKLMAPNHSHKITVLYNWLTPTKKVSNNIFGKKFIVNNNLSNKFIFFYGGNIGISQDIDNLLRLSKRFKNENNIRFLFIGQGDKYSYLEKKIFSENLSNIVLVPSITQEEYKSVLREIDVGLFSLAATHKSHNFPGKILGYLDAQIPILGSVNKGNDIIEVINDSGAGKVVVNGNDEDFYMEAYRIFKSKAVRNRMSSRSKILMQNQFSVDVAVKNILSKLDKNSKFL